MSMYNMVVYHDDLDGFTSAYIAWRESSNRDSLVAKDAEYHCTQYGWNLPDVKGKDVLVLDFHYLDQDLKKLLDESNSIFIIDHHKTTREHFPDGHPNFIIGDNKSGALLTWEYLNPGIPVPDYVKYVNDQDLWLNEIPEARRFAFRAGMVGTRSNAFSDFYVLIHNMERTLEEGSHIERYVDKQIANDSKKSFISMLKYGNNECLVQTINGYTPWSNNTANNIINLKPDIDVGMTYVYDGNRDTYIISLRSRKDGTDVSKIAEFFGGGGHRSASGFRFSGNIMDIITPIPDLSPRRGNS